MYRQKKHYLRDTELVTGCRSLLLDGFKRHWLQNAMNELRAQWIDIYEHAIYISLIETPHMNFSVRESTQENRCKLSLGAKTQLWLFEDSHLFIWRARAHHHTAISHTATIKHQQTSQRFKNIATVSLAVRMLFVHGARTFLYFHDFHPRQFGWFTELNGEINITWLSFFLFKNVFGYSPLVRQMLIKMKNCWIISERHLLHNHIEETIQILLH